MDWDAMLGRGIYAIPEAARLTGVSSQRIRRWMEGYSYRTATGEHAAPPVWTHDLPKLDDAFALSFRDLIEVRFIDVFLRHGVRWKALRRAAEVAAEIIESTHPFSTKKFKTDGREIFLEIVDETQEPSLLNLVKDQYTFHEVVDPHLFDALEFGPQGTPSRWYPLHPNKRVVVDPRLSFGQPIVEAAGVPTYVIAAAEKVEDSRARVARLYEVTPADVDAAIEFEARHAA